MKCEFLISISWCNNYQNVLFTQWFPLSLRDQKRFYNGKSPFCNAALRAVPCLEISFVFFGKISTRAYSHTVVSLMHCLSFWAQRSASFSICETMRVFALCRSVLLLETWSLPCEKFAKLMSYRNKPFKRNTCHSSSAAHDQFLSRWNVFQFISIASFGFA